MGEEGGVMMQWRRQMCSVPAGFLRLDVFFRGIVHELRRYCDDQGRVELGPEHPGLEVAYLLGARPYEHESIRSGVERLIEDGFLRLKGTVITIVGFVDEQRSSEANRKAKYRASMRVHEVHGRDMSRDMSQGLSGTRGTGEENRREEKREEEIPPVGPPQGDMTPPARRPPNRVRKGRQDTLPLGPQLLSLEGGKDASGRETPTQTAWRVWRELYGASRRRYGPYVDGDSCGKTMVALAKQAQRLVVEREHMFEPLLRHWFQEYLRDDGQRNFLVEQRHALQFMPRGIPTYGAPWSKAQAKRDTLPDVPEPNHERRIIRTETKAEGVPAPAGLMAQIARIGQ